MRVVGEGSGPTPATFTNHPHPSSNTIETLTVINAMTYIQ